MTELTEQQRLALIDLIEEEDECRAFAQDRERQRRAYLPPATIIPFPLNVARSEPR